MQVAHSVPRISMFVVHAASWMVKQCTDAEKIFHFKLVVTCFTWIVYINAMEYFWNLEINVGQWRVWVMNILLQKDKKTSPKNFTLISL